MMAKCPKCNRIVRITEHRVFIVHNTWVKTEMNGKEYKARTICKGSFTKAVFVEP